MKAVVWSKDACPFCDAGKESVKSLKGIEYEERNISTRLDSRATIRSGTRR
jgi:glutaredoxin